MVTIAVSLSTDQIFLVAAAGEFFSDASSGKNAGRHLSGKKNFFSTTASNHARPHVISTFAGARFFLVDGPSQNCESMQIISHLRVIGGSDSLRAAILF